MIRIKKYMKTVASVGLLASVLAGCTETEEISVADLYQKAYVTTDMYPQTEGLYTYSRILSGPTIGIENGRMVIHEATEQIIFEGKSTHEIYFRTLYAVNADLTGTLSVPENAEELIAAYNAANGYTGGKAYIPLTPEYYTITKGTATIKSGRKSGEEPFVVEFVDDIVSLPEGNYILPLICSLPEGAGVQMSDKMDYLYLKFTTSSKDETGPRERILYNNADFSYTIGEGSSFYTDPYGASSLFNDNVNDVCYCASTNSSVTIAFTEPVYLSRLGLALYNQYGFGTKQYYYLEWTYEDGTTANAGDGWLSTEEYTAPTVHWCDISADYLDKEKKVKDISFSIYNNYYSYSEIYLIAFEK